MAREFAKVYTSLWADRDFIALSADAQRIYLMLISQDSLSRCGVTTIAMNRWVGMASDSPRERVQAGLRELVEAKFVLADHSTDELLVRSFVKNDGGWKSPNIALAIASAARAIVSPRLREEVRQCILDLDFSHVSENVNKNTNRSPRDFIWDVFAQLCRDISPDGAFLEPQKKITLRDALEPAVTATPAESADPGEGLAVAAPEPQAVESEPGMLPDLGFPELGGPVDEPAPARTRAHTQAPAREKKPSTKKPGKGDDAFDAFWAVYPRKADKKKARQAWARAVRDADPETIIAGAENYAADPNRVDQYTKLPASWLNAGAWENGALPERPGGGASAPAPFSGGRPAAAQTSGWPTSVEAENQLFERAFGVPREYRDEDLDIFAHRAEQIAAAILSEARAFEGTRGRQEDYIETVRAWARALPEWVTMEWAVKAVRDHYAKTTVWIKPMHVIDLARDYRTREARAEGRVPEDDPWALTKGEKAKPDEIAAAMEDLKGNPWADRLAKAMANHS